MSKLSILTEFGTLGADSTGSWHGNAVAGLAAGSHNNTTGALGVMGVAFDADMRWATYHSIPSGTAWVTDWYTQIANDAHDANVVVVNNSWGVSMTNYACNNAVIAGSADWCHNNGIINPTDTWPVTSANVDDFRAYKANFGLTDDETFSTIVNQGSTSTSAINSWRGWISALDNLQSKAIIIYALSNVPGETEPGVYSALPVFYTELEDAFLGVGFSQVEGSAISSSTVKRYGNPCGEAMKNCFEKS